MICPYCGKDIYGVTGLQELQKFQKHLQTCQKAPQDTQGINIIKANELRYRGEEYPGVDQSLENL